MTGDHTARRYPASAFPEIQGIRLTPLGAAATLVNLSATGALIECASRPVPGTGLTVHFKGTFSPASIESRVVRCEVAGIANDGSLRYHLGVAFNTRLALPNDALDDVDEPAEEPSAPLPAVVAVDAPVLRNRW
jgi:PilZ domain